MGKLPTVWGNSLEADTGNIIELGTPQWLDWLESRQSFRYEPNTGNGFTVRQEKAGYWYGYRKVAGKLHKRYIGTSDDLTANRLNEVSQLLEQPTQPRSKQVTDKVAFQVTEKQYATKDDVEQLKSEIAALRAELRGKLVAW